MSVVELEPTITELPAWDLSPMEEALIKMRRLVEDDHWGRDQSHYHDENGRMRYCMLGLIENASGNYNETYRDLMPRMNAAIGEEGREEIRHYPPHMIVNGGISRGPSGICTFNNTRKDVSEIIEWIDRALQL